VEVPTRLPLTRRDWPQALQELARQLDDGRSYDRDLSGLSVALDAILEAYSRRPYVRLRAADERHAIWGPRHTPLIRVMLATGLRRGEALALHWPDVDLDAELLRVRWTLSPDGPGAAARRAQTATTPAGPCHSALGRRGTQSPRRRRLEGRLAAAGGRQEHGLVFTTEIGTPLESRNVLRRFELLAERAGLPCTTLHTLRHSAASFLLAGGTHTKVVQEHLGHSSCAIAADIYSHDGPVQQREAGGPARRGRALVTVAVLRPRGCTRCCTHARGGSASTAKPPLICGSARADSATPDPQASAAGPAHVRACASALVDRYTERRRTQANRPEQGSPVVKMMVRKVRVDLRERRAPSSVHACWA
jgi:integrase